MATVTVLQLLTKFLESSVPGYAIISEGLQHILGTDVLLVGVVVLGTCAAIGFLVLKHGLIYLSCLISVEHDDLVFKSVAN